MNTRPGKYPQAGRANCPAFAGKYQVTTLPILTNLMTNEMTAWVQEREQRRKELVLLDSISRSHPFRISFNINQHFGIFEFWVVKWLPPYGNHLN
ncbi:MAG: hypothetical protein ACXWTK_09390 [Methylobacter sp.]